MANETLPNADAGRLDRGVMRPRDYRYACDRVRVALGRLSRDRWLPPADVQTAALRLAECVSRNPSWTADKACPKECTVVGMLKGAPPAWMWDADYGAFVRALSNLNTSKPNAGELAILQLTLKRMKHGR
jgi:hypothetical protein